MKQCFKCKETKPLSEFHNNKSRKDGKQHYCRPCQTLTIRESRKRSQSKPCSRCGEKKRIKGQTYCSTCVDHYKYGLTKEQSEHFRSIKHCQACGRTKHESGRPLHLDHCHDNGHGRGILCHQCNVALGQLNNDPVRIRQLEMYINNVNYHHEQATVSSN